MLQKKHCKIISLRPSKTWCFQKRTGNPVKAVNATNNIPNAALLSRSPPLPSRSKSEGDGIHSKPESTEDKDEKVDCIFDEESIQKQVHNIFCSCLTGYTIFL